MIKVIILWSGLNITKITVSFQIKILTFFPKQTCNKEGEHYAKSTWDLATDVNFKDNL